MTNNTHLESVADRLGQRIASRLTHCEANLPYVVTERLRASREQALAVRKRPALDFAHQAKPAHIDDIQVHRDGSLSLGTSGHTQWAPHWLRKALTILPIAAMVAGITMITIEQDDLLTLDVAEMDTELLTDTLPPDAYTDPGFIQFLQSDNASVN